VTTLASVEAISFELDRGSKEPLYRQLRRLLEQRLLSGEYARGARLPSSRELALELGLSRNTVNTAYQELVAEGFLVARPRSGLYLNDEVSLSQATAKAGRGVPPASLAWSGRLRAEPDAGMPEIEKISDWQHFPYPFIAGQVEVRSFPVAAWTRALRDALDPPHLHYSLRDAISADDPLLVEMLCRHILPARGIEADPEEVLVTVGSQQGLSFLARALLAPGTKVAVEDPGYLDARHIFVRSQAQLVPLPIDQSGVVPPPDLAGVGLLYLTPSHQHPTNATLSIGRRQQLLHLASEADTLVLEDDYDSELRYLGNPSPSLKSLDRSDRVVYMGTFSKFLAPGLRLGYLVGARELIEHLRAERRYSIRHPAGQIQRAMGLFIQSGQYHRAVRRHRALLRRKWEAMASAIDRHFPWPVPLPAGGVTVWVESPEPLDGAKLAREAQRHGVIIERGDIFFADPRAGRHCFRLGYSAIPLEAIEPGIRVLGQLLREQRRTRRAES